MKVIIPGTSGLTLLKKSVYSPITLIGVKVMREETSFLLSLVPLRTHLITWRTQIHIFMSVGEFLLLKKVPNYSNFRKIHIKVMQSMKKA